MLAQLVVPPYAGRVTPRSTEIAGTRSTKVTSVCQELAAIPRVAFTLSTRALPVLTVGCAVVSGPSSSAKAIWASSSRWCCPRKNSTLCSSRAARTSATRRGVEVAVEADAVDDGADAAADLADPDVRSGGRAGSSWSPLRSS